MSAVDSLTVADSIIFGLPGTGADFGLLRFSPALTASPGSSLNVFSPNGSECVSLYSSTLSFQWAEPFSFPSISCAHFSS